MRVIGPTLHVGLTIDARHPPSWRIDLELMEDVTSAAVGVYGYGGDWDILTAERFGNTMSDDVPLQFNCSMVVKCR